jgi:hypothetical protein
MDKTRRNGAPLPPEMPGMWLPLLDRAWLGQDKHVRWKFPGIPVSWEEMRHDRRMGDKTVRITVVAAILMVVAFIAALLLLRALAEKPDGGSDPKHPHHGTES